MVFLKPWVRPWSEAGRIVYISAKIWFFIKPWLGVGAEKCFIFNGFLKPWIISFFSLFVRRCFELLLPKVGDGSFELLSLR